MSDDVVKLVTLPERAAEEQRTYLEMARAEAVAMLEKAIEMARERGVVSVAIALAFDDGAYGSLVPMQPYNFGHLVGAVADMQHRLLVHSNQEPGT